MSELVARCPVCREKRSVLSTKLYKIGEETYLFLVLDCGCPAPLTIKLESIIDWHNQLWDK